MNLFNDNSEEFFWDRMKGHKFPFNKDAWNKMEKILDRNPSTAPLYKSWTYKLFMLGSVLLILISSTFSHYHFKDKNNPVSISEIIDYTTAQFSEPTDQKNNEYNDLSYEYSFSETQAAPFFIDFRTLNELQKLGGQLADLCCIDKIIEQEEQGIVLSKQSHTGPFYKSISAQVSQYSKHLNEEKVYLQFDRTYFQPGENIWFKAYVRDAQTFKESEKSNVVYVQLLSVNDKVEKTLSLVVKNGGAGGDFYIENSTENGKYKIRAFTNWQRNKGEYFERIIQVEDVPSSLVWNIKLDKPTYKQKEQVKAKLQVKNKDNQFLPNQRFFYYVIFGNEKLISENAMTDKKGKANIQFELPSEFKDKEGVLHLKIDGYKKIAQKAIPSDIRKIDLQFMPEGGELIAGYKIRTGFKAIGDDGKSINVNGEIFNSSDEKVGTFASYHAGMGTFQFVPQKGQKYYAKITSPKSFDKKYPVPGIMEDGYSIKLEENTKEKIELKLLSTQESTLTLVARSRDKILMSEELEKERGWSSYSVDITDWPVGVAQFTLFDKQKNPQSERLVFINNGNRVDLKIETNKKVYQPREKITMRVSAKTQDGQPAPGSYSLSVTDNKLLSFANDRQGNILSYMLLESELKGEIEDPNFYFDESKPKALKALDHLVMVQGYRRFSWDEVQNNPIADLNYINEKSEIKGQILDTRNQPIKDAIVKLIANTKKEQEQITDEEGLFAFVDVDLRDAIRLDIEADDCSANWHPVFMYSNNLKLGLNPYPAMARDLTEYPSGYVPPMYPKQSRIVEINGEPKTVNEKLMLKEPHTELIVRPAMFDTKMKKVLVKPENGKSPVYETMKEKVLIKEATTEIKSVPAEYETLTIQVVDDSIVNQDLSRQLNSKGELKISTNPKDWELFEKNKSLHINVSSVGAFYFEKPYKEDTKNKNWQISVKNVQTPATNKVETIPAEYKTIVKKELVNPDGFREVQIGAEFKTVLKPILQIPATATSPAVYDTLQEEVLIKPAHTKIEKVEAEYKTITEKVLTRKEIRRSISTSVEYKVSKKMVNERTFNAYAQKFKYGFYRARKFYTPKYTKAKVREEINDIRRTLFWEPNMIIGDSGYKTISFYNGDATTSFRVTTEGVSENGLVGNGTYSFDSKMPVQVEATMPVAVSTGDKFTVPVKVINNMEQTLIGKLNLKIPDGIKLISEQLEKYSVDALETTTIPLEYEVINKTSGEFAVEFLSRGIANGKSVNLLAEYPGEKITRIFSGKNTSNNFEIELPKETIKGSVNLSLNIYPSKQAKLSDIGKRWYSNSKSDLEKVISSFEPNLQLLEFGEKDRTISTANEKTAKELLGKTLKELSNFELEDGGFYWSNPDIGHELFTAVALAYLTRASKLTEVDSKLIDRTTNWLLKKRNNNGGWNLQKENTYIGINNKILEASINWALTEAGLEKQISNQLEHAYQAMTSNEDLYHKVLIANSLINIQDVRGTELLAELLVKQQTNGSWIANSPTFSNKTGQFQTIETTALMVRAIKKSFTGLDRVELAQEFLSKSFDLVGDISGIESALILNSIQEDKLFSIEKGDVTILINGVQVAFKNFTVGNEQPVTIDGLERYLKLEKNKIEVLLGTESIEYELHTTYHINTAIEQTSGYLSFEKAIDSDRLTIGQVVPVVFKIKNINGKQAIPYPVIEIKIPGGMVVETWQLDKIKVDKKILDYKSNLGSVTLMLDSFRPKEEKELNIGLRTMIEGDFEAPHITIKVSGQIIDRLATSQNRLKVIPID